MDYCLKGGRDGMIFCSRGDCWESAIKVSSWFLMR